MAKAACARATTTSRSRSSSARWRRAPGHPGKAACEIAGHAIRPLTISAPPGQVRREQQPDVVRRAPILRQELVGEPPALLADEDRNLLAVCRDQLAGIGIDAALHAIELVIEPGEPCRMEIAAARKAAQERLRHVAAAILDLEWIIRSAANASASAPVGSSAWIGNCADTVPRDSTRTV